DDRTLSESTNGTSEQSRKRQVFFHKGEQKPFYGKKLRLQAVDARGEQKKRKGRKAQWRKENSVGPLPFACFHPPWIGAGQHRLQLTWPSAEYAKKAVPFGTAS